VSEQPYPVFRCEGQKDRIPHPVFCQTSVATSDVNIRSDVFRDISDV